MALIVHLLPSTPNYTIRCLTQPLFFIDLSPALVSSLTTFQRDGAWIHTLLEEAENERMHLLTFLSLKQPGFWLRALVLASQGVFYNVFFATYLFAPKAAHRFVACLEEEAVVTYTRLIDDIQEGRLPEWEGVVRSVLNLHPESHLDESRS